MPVGAFVRVRVIVHSTPSRGLDVCAVPPWVFTLCSISVVPKPDLPSGDTGGPPRSLQRSTRVSSDTVHCSAIRPRAVESAPYLRASYPAREGSRPDAPPCARAIEPLARSRHAVFVQRAKADLVADQGRQIGRLPGAVAEQRMRLCERLDAGRKIPGELRRIFGVAQSVGRDGLHCREGVLTQ